MATTIEFGWFGSHVRVFSTEPGVVRLIRRRWGALPAAAAGAPTREYRIRREAGGRVLESPGGIRALDEARPAVHAYNLLITDLLGQVGEHFVFHAMAVARDGQALLISGPSTFGKTTLGIGLCRRGFGMLADDFAVTERRSGRVQPFARSLNMRPSTRDELDQRQLAAALAARFEESEEGWAVDPVRWLGPPPEPAPISMVVLLRPHQDGSGLRRFPHYEIATLRGEEARLAELPGLPGVHRVEVDESRPSIVRVSVSDTQALTGWLERHERGLVHAVKFASAPPDFSGEPELLPIGTVQAAIELNQELLNRHPGSRLAEEFLGQEARQVVEVARSLSKASCFALLPGRLPSTVEILEQAFARVTQ